MAHLLDQMVSAGNSTEAKNILDGLVLMTPVIVLHSAQ